MNVGQSIRHARDATVCSQSTYNGETVELQEQGNHLIHGYTHEAPKTSPNSAKQPVLSRVTLTARASNTALAVRGMNTNAEL